MKNSIRAFAVAASAIVGIFASTMAMGSTISKNIPGAVRHPVNEVAKKVGADAGPNHYHPNRHYRHTTYSRGTHRYRTHYSSGYASSTHHHRVHHYRHHS